LRYSNADGREGICDTDYMTNDETYERILEEARNDAEVLGFALTGGRGKGFVTEHSDYDIYIVVTDGYTEAAKRKYPSTITPYKFDILVHTLESLREYASFGSPIAWDRYNFAHVKTVFDRTDGEIQRIIDEKGTIPKDRIEVTAKADLDAYINHYYRSLKNGRDGDAFASRIDATESAQCLLAFVFSAEGRIKPYSKYIVWALEHHPLEHLPWSAAEFVSILGRLFETGDIGLQKEVFKTVRRYAVDRGYQETIDSWEGCYLG
jgi:hypothetical protein